MCSVAYAQTKPKNQTKPKKSKQKLEQVKSVTAPFAQIIDSLSEEEANIFDPMDTVKLVKSSSAMNAKVKYTCRDSMPYSLW
jgi:hypothetical protein